MKRLTTIYALLLCSALALPAQEREVKLKLVETSDIHGNYYSYNFITQEEWAGSLARVYAYVEEQRKTYKDNLLLVDNGDILQGQPTAYYYNYIDTISPHVCASMMNYMGYVAGNMGNHDVETGHSVFNRWIEDCDFPILGANIIDRSTAKPYLKPYVIVKRKGVKVAILGMITSGIPVWLPENLWKGLQFDDMEETARYWMKVIREQEKPDLIVGLFHSGQEAQVIGGRYNENASLDVARNVPGFDVVMMGHDHSRECKKIANIAGDSVLVVDPAFNGIVVADIDVTFKLKNGKVKSKEISGKLTDVKDYGVSEAFMTRFAEQQNKVQAFVSKKIGTFTEELKTRSAFFGPSGFVDFIHSLQLDLSKADISFSAPLAFDAVIEKGDVRVSDMFNLYKYENMLYVMKLSGKEIKGFLEMSYYIWTNQMKSPEDHLLWFKEVPTEGMGEQAAFQNFSFNFDSAAGITYTVDVTKPQGEKINIISMADGSPFYLDKIYKVVTNSYRGNGGGELLTKGAGIPQDQLKDRILFSTNKDLRFYMMQYISEKKVLNPRALNQWKFIPEEWTTPAAKRDYIYLYGRNSNKK